MQQSAGPGDLLADRYLLVDLLTESGNGRFWRAHDRVLERHVALHCLAEDDARADDLTEAARVSATVLDRRILRVLDADRRDGIAYVVNEWGSGTSLDILVGGEGTLAPRRAAWIVAEVAASMAVAHEQRVAHGRLVPENVLIDQTGQVRVIGFCVDAALLGIPPGQVSHDVDDLGGLLYFLLTGKWAGPSESDMPPALRDHGKWLRPRQVRAGIPRVLDTICDQVLNPYSAEPGHQEFNLHTSRGLADVLAEYVGDPTGLIQPAVGGVVGAGVLAVPERRPPSPRHPEPEPASDPEPEPEPEPEWEATQLVPTEPDPTVTMRVPPPVIPPDEPHSDDPSPVSTPPSPVDHPTQAGMPIFDDEADDVSWLERRSEPPPPPPRLEEPPERPLFAPTPPDGTPSRTPRPGAAPVTGEYWPWETPGPGTDSGVIPVAEVVEEDDAVPGRSWFRLAVLIALSLLLLIGVVIAYNLGRGKTPLGAEPEPEPPPSSSAPTVVPATPIEGTTARAFDPQGETADENSDQAPLAVDGDPATAWPTSLYFDQFGPAGLKTGVGLVVDLGESLEVSQIDLTTVGSPTDVTYYLTDTDPTAVADLEPITEETVSQERLRTKLDEPATGQYLIIWITSLPAVGGDFRAEIAEVVVSQVSQ
ncbi:MAG: protein kinase family protein [Nocardioides sp.]